MRKKAETFKRLHLPKTPLIAVIIAALILSGGIFMLLYNVITAPIAHAEAAAHGSRVFDPGEDVLYKDGDGNILYRFAYGSGNGAAPEFSGETDDDGIPVGPYLLATAAHLDNIRNVDTYTDMLYFRMVADIDLADYLAEGGDGYKQDGWAEAGWKPIDTMKDGRFKASFCGIFDGDGFEISNLWIDRPTEENVGLFDICGGTITNLKVIIDPIKGITGGSYTGALAGAVSPDAQDFTPYISGCSVLGRVEATCYDSYFFCGGLAGEIRDLTVSECYFVGTLSGELTTEENSEFRGLGGIAGVVSDTIILNSYADVTFEITGISYSKYAAGIVGSYMGTENTIKNTYAVHNGQIKAGPIIATPLSIRGSKPAYTADGCCYTGSAATVSTEKTLGITRHSVDEATGSGNYKNNEGDSWDFTTVWGIFEGEGLPYLRAFNNAVLLTPISDNDTYNGNTKTPNDISVMGEYDKSKPITIAGIATTDNSMINAGEYVAAVAYKTAHAYQVTVGKYEIKKATVTVAVAPLSRNVYGEMPEVKYIFTGFAEGESEDNIALNGLDSLTLTTTAQHKRGTFDTVLSGNLSADNYAFVYQNSEITLTGLYYGEIAGISVGGAVLFALVAFSLVWFVIKKKTFAELLAGIKGIFIKTNTVTVTETVYIEKQTLPFPDSFSKKEREIAVDLISGMPRHEIAEKHFISQNTLLSHIKKIYSKADCQSQVEFMTKYSE